MEYPPAVTQFTQKQCDSISSPVLRACLSQMGYNSNMPREVVYGPSVLGGIGIHDLYIERGIKQITTLVGHVRQQSDTGRMMINQLEWCQVQAGTAISLLEAPTIPIDYIEDCWIMCIRDFLATYKMQIEIIQKARTCIQCENDEFIMDALRSRGNCSATELQNLNACRLFLKVEQLS